MDFVDKPTGVADPGFSMEPLVTEEESRADMERAQREMDMDEPMFGQVEDPDPVGDDTEGMGFMEFLDRERGEQEDLPPLF